MIKIYLTILSLVPFISLNAQNIPVDFEAGGNGANWNWTVFENDDNPPLEIIANPDPSGINTSATVAKFTARQTGNPWAGCETLHGAGIGTWTVDANNSTIKIMVWKDVISDVGIKFIRADDWALLETKVANTLTNQWEEITFDFSAHMGNTYDKVAIFPDFNARSSESIVYFDNFNFTNSNPTALNNEIERGISLYPNPVNDQLNLSFNKEIDKVSIYDYSGKLVLEKEIQSNFASINTTELNAGIYILKSLVSGEVEVQKFLKN